MKFCRFNSDRLGLVDGGTILDVSAALDILPDVKWVRSLSDPFVENIEEIIAKVRLLADKTSRVSVSDVVLEAPVALPSKIIGAPVNYHAHLDEAQDDQDLHQGRSVYPIDEIGCFLKAGSSLIGSGSTISIPEHFERVDQEAEVAIIIGKTAKNVKAAHAMSHIAGYSLSLDMTVRGKQDRSMRKSCDGFAVLGPTLVTADEIRPARNIPFELTINGEVKQSTDTGRLIRSIPELIEMCSAFYTLLPGNVIMTGTPAGVGPVSSGDKIKVTSPLLGTLEANIQ